MIARLRGELVHKDASGAVVDCGGVGYGVAMSLSALARIGDLGKGVELLVYTHVTQESLRLFGFLEAEEKRLFEVLIGISGVGPKLALAVLSTMSPSELGDVVAREDARALVRIPGVGKKTAQRLLLELKDRLPAAEIVSPAVGLRDDLESALVNLGFNAAAAAKATEVAMAGHPGEVDLASLVRAALRASTKV